jgi:hypothetical protein
VLIVGTRGERVTEIFGLRWSDMGAFDYFTSADLITDDRARTESR